MLAIIARENEWERYWVTSVHMICSTVIELEGAMTFLVNIAYHCTAIQVEILKHIGKIT